MEAQLGHSASVAQLQHPVLGGGGGEFEQVRGGLIEHLGPERVEERLAPYALEMTEQQGVRDVGRRTFSPAPSFPAGPLGE